MDARVAAGERPPLAGVPVAMKDNMWVAGRKTGCASRILEGFRPPGDSTVAARLRAAGAVFVGRANMDEFAMGSSTENSAYQVTRNPWDLERVAGGSSGGSAAAVAARFVPAGFGSDTGGSIRQPAACCGVVGFKPTYGRVSRYGLVAFASSLDQIGPIARSVGDAARLYRVIAGVDPRDSTTADVAVGDPEGAVERGVRGLRVGFLREAEEEGLEAEVSASLDEARRIFRDAGAEVVSVSVPRTSVVDLDLLRRGERGGLLQPGALRRRPLRAAQVRRRPGFALRRDADRRLRPRGQAAHPARHLRARLRVLRGVLRRGDARAAAPARRLRPGVRARRT